MYEGMALIVDVGRIVILFLGLISCFLGILLIPQKKGYVREPAIFLILSGLITIYANSSNFFARMGNEAFVKYGYLGILIQILQIVAVILLFLYARKRYDAEGLAVVIILPIAWLFLHKIVQVALLRSSLGLSFIKNQTLFASYTALSNLALIAVMIFIAVMYYRNKDKENVFPYIWIFPVLFAVSYTLNSVTSIMLLSIAGAIPAFLIKLVTAIVYPAFGFYLIVNMNSSEKYIDSQNV